MIIVNWPFFVSMIVLVILLPLRIFERYFSDRGIIKWLSEKWNIRQNSAKSTAKKTRKPSRLGLFLKKVFIQDKELKRPFYVSMPIFVCIMGYNLLPMLLGWNRWQWLLDYAMPALAVTVIVVTFSGTLLMLLANRVTFRDQERRKAFLKVEARQFAVAFMIFLLVIGFVHFQLGRTDTRDMRNSVNWVLEPEYEANWPSFSEGLAPVVKWGKEVPVAEIRYQLAKGYYKKMLLGLPD